MVKVKDESAMAEPKPTQQSSLQSTVYYNSRKSRNNNNSINNNTNNNNNNNSNNQHQQQHHHHHHYYHYHPHPLHHRSHLSHYTTGETIDGNTNSGSTSPAKFCLGPGFEPQQTQQQSGTGGNNFGGAGPSQTQNNEHIVMFHVNPGVSISLQIGDNIQLLSGKFLR